MFTTSCSHTLHYITLQPTLSHCTTSHYSLHSHTALHHTTAYTLTLHYITLQSTLSHCTTSHYSLHSHTALYITPRPTLSHCTTSHYSLHSHTALHHTTAYTFTMLILLFGASSSLYSSQSHHPDLHQFSQHVFVAPVLICTPPHLNVV